MRSEREEVTREETIEGEVRPPLRGREGEGERGERGGKRGRCPVTGFTKVTGGGGPGGGRKRGGGGGGGKRERARAREREREYWSVIFNRVSAGSFTSLDNKSQSLETELHRK